MHDFLGNYFIHNHKILEFDSVLFEHFNSNKSIYEVFRLIEGKPLFLKEHLERLNKTCNITACRFRFNNKDLIDAIQKLIVTNQITIGNIKLLISFDTDSKNNDYIGFFVKHYYPTKEEISKGVPLKLLYAERENPNAKLSNIILRQTANTIIKENKLYEVLLVNKSNEITEGSRTNVFFVKDNQIFTSPLPSVLPGITLLKIISICKNLNIQVIETAISVESINKYEAAFLTGTSTSVLPIGYIEDISYNTKNKTIQKIANAYEKLLNEDIKHFKF